MLALGGRVNAGQAEELEGVIGIVFPGSGVVVVPEEDGAKIAMTIDAIEHKFSIGDGDSTLLRMLLAGRVPW